MDVLMLFMLVATLAPLYFAKRNLKVAAVIQFALMLGMWDYFFSHFTSITVLNAPTSIFAFYASLLLADAAVIMFLIRSIKEVQKKDWIHSFRSSARNDEYKKSARWRRSLG
ncbi:hypothetical protein [Salibacterium halotolerans]|uniref:Uncharacterized protein n=1 Tax=Salibacterium halotolerans TaxID=1884432 RepID=A0A1I5TPT5_9BACI|nr:hypothetical protein [Salibacterium halotolerans]SFP85062.1 hypothetical protein SAMN05518683_11142 [Salibacterium halotolerans]